MNNRTRLRVNVGNLFEVLGALNVVGGVAWLVGLAYGLILLGVLLVVGAELIYDSTVLRIPLPHRPHPTVKLRAARVRFERWHWDRRIKRLVDGSEQ